MEVLVSPDGYLCKECRKTNSFDLKVLKLIRDVREVSFWHDNCVIICLFFYICSVIYFR